MKKSVDRPSAADGEAGLVAGHFRQQDEHGNEAVSWSQRAVQIQAQAHDERAGAEQFARLWAADSHAVTLSAAELARMSGYLRYVSVPAAQQLIDQDEPGDYLLIVLSGRVAVEHVQQDGSRSRMAEAREGDMLGEMSLLDAGTRFSACRTLTPCVLAVLEAHHLDEVMNAEPRLALALLASLARRLSLRLRRVSARLSALLSGG
jgi:CRP/FNR family transcriptional regulator, cyclic AMP receptor protein